MQELGQQSLFNGAPKRHRGTRAVSGQWNWWTNEDGAHNSALFMHCLPVRRNVIVTDGVIDSPASVVIDEAENRLHVQKAILKRLVV